ncbi:MAG: VanW family protein [Candidatus Yanofskybacteria bacterium]|nr:VanW family protein [Candidatus Yanofskybacteria bacterium]
MATLPDILKSTRTRIVGAVAAGIVVLGTTAYGWYTAERIVPNTWVGSVDVGGLTRDEAALRLQDELDRVAVSGVQLSIDGAPQSIDLDTVGFDLNIAQAVDEAFVRGHGGSLPARLGERIRALWHAERVAAPIRVDENALRAQVAEVADVTDVDRRDVRLEIEGTTVRVLTDTKPGRAINQQEAFSATLDTLRALGGASIALQLYDDPPRIDPATADDAALAARRMIARPLTLQYEDLFFTINREKIGSWIVSHAGASDGPQQRTLVASVDPASVAAYVTTVARTLNVDPQPPQITTEGGRVTGFVPPKVGRAVKEDVLVQMIVDALASRASNGKVGDVLTVPLKATSMALEGLDAAAGIREIIGRATTPFAGSPKNRISNIKNGVKFLTGAVVKAGEEFSTLQTLGTIDNTTGYLPELVIKGDRTLPEFGGGLCQVSTTLFRAVLNAGLPVTARRNHSYRVTYYEKDGDGKKIGPGLDATIYEPNVDFKFKNDTAHPILIIGYVIGDKVSFDLYGTKDGRTSQLIGPRTLTETPPGEPVYIETTELAPGVVKQVETPHPGGSAVATYVVTYPDGHKEVQEFKSWYRKWPAKYLKGVAQLSSTPSPLSAAQE